MERGSMHRSPTRRFPRQRGPPARSSVISRSAYFTMPIAARTGGGTRLPRIQGNSRFRGSLARVGMCGGQLLQWTFCMHAAAFRQRTLNDGVGELRDNGPLAH